MAQDNYSERASRGQAYNLAVQQAIADGKGHDTEYVTHMFLKHLQFAAILQKANIPELEKLMQDSEFIELLKTVDSKLEDTVSRLKNLKA